MDPSCMDEHARKIEELRLDFHNINFTYCKENQFSNEKISTFLTMMDYLLTHMLDK